MAVWVRRWFGSCSRLFGDGRRLATAVGAGNGHAEKSSAFACTRRRVAGRRPARGARRVQNPDTSVTEWVLRRREVPVRVDCVPHPQAQPPRAVSDLPVFTQLDQPDFGRDVASLAEALFDEPNMGLMRTSGGGYTAGSVFVYRNVDIRSLVSHPDLGNQTIDAYACPYDDAAEEVPSGFRQLMRNSLFTMQPPVHAPARRLVSRQLTARSISRIVGPVRVLIDALIDEAAEHDEVDFRTIADRVMSGFWQSALGWTAGEADEACRLAATSQLSNLFNPTAGQRRAVNQASRDLIELLERTVGRRRSAGGQPLLVDLSADHAALDGETADRLPPLDALFGAGLLDGLHSLGGVIASVVHALLQAPDAHAAVCGDQRLVAPAFLEGVRLHPAVILTQRQALRDLSIHDVRVPAGSPVTMAWLFGNRDPAAFDAPWVYRLGRPQRHQSTFGGGAYVCPGRNVVRLLGEMVLAALTAPSVTIESAGPARWVPATGLHELDSMPVVLRRSRGSARG